MVHLQLLASERIGPAGLSPLWQSGDKEGSKPFFESLSLDYNRNSSDVFAQPMPSNYYAAPQYPQYTSGASGAPAAMPVYASAAGPSGAPHSQQDALAGVKVLLRHLCLLATPSFVFPAHLLPPDCFLPVAECLPQAMTFCSCLLQICCALGQSASC